MNDPELEVFEAEELAEAYSLARPHPTSPEELRSPEQLAELILRQLELLGEDPEREGLTKTPMRVAHSLLRLTEGYELDLHQVVNGAVFAAEGADLVVVRDIEFYSLCEHHLLPFYGRVHVAYLPDRKVIGLSKIPRIVDMFARRLQLQERFTAQVADALMEAVEPKGVAVVATALHFCMMMRGVEKQHSKTTTSAFRGIFRTDQALREEVLRTLGEPTVHTP